jgi:hypothetical protein
MTRTILIHLRVDTSDEDSREPDEIASDLVGSIEPSPENDPHHFCVSTLLAQELEATA